MAEREQSGMGIAWMTAYNSEVIVSIKKFYLLIP